MHSSARVLYGVGTVSHPENSASIQRLVSLVFVSSPGRHNFIDKLPGPDFVNKCYSDIIFSWGRLWEGGQLRDNLKGCLWPKTCFFDWDEGE